MNHQETARFLERVVLKSQLTGILQVSSLGQDGSDSSFSLNQLHTEHSFQPCARDHLYHGHFVPQSRKLVLAQNKVSDPRACAGSTQTFPWSCRSTEARTRVGATQTFSPFVNEVSFVFFFQFSQSHQTLHSFGPPTSFAVNSQSCHFILMDERQRRRTP